MSGTARPESRSKRRSSHVPRLDVITVRLTARRSRLAFSCQLLHIDMQQTSCSPLNRAAESQNTAWGGADCAMTSGMASAACNVQSSLMTPEALLSMGPLEDRLERVLRAALEDEGALRVHEVAT